MPKIYLSSGAATREEIDAYYSMILDLCNSIGLLQDFRPGAEMEKLATSKVLQMLLNLKEELRRRGAYDLSDRIRESLKEVGILVEGTKERQRVRLKR
ncbi:MAG: hypothetical protein B9J98_01965 [Candidatus Terraquivivens tikiterensis]|uniref:Uncharacterized protein n=1 Tax=Candidatus Terraquivivens tikiterensis TaxID=1980982 RepID=A0A2R7Y876_9ARCH|nr:MAG: hypothetical protein B9J98_01965 [Candidatus Terraquivivens tikiterensis]